MLRHVDVETVLAHPQPFSSSLGGTQIRDPASAEALRYVRQSMLNMDPPEHTRLRRLLENAFTAHRVKSLEPRIRQIVVDLLEPLAQRGFADGMKDIGAPLTAQIIS